VVAQGGGVQRDEAVTLVAAQIGDQPRLDALVTIEDEDREHGADLGPDHLGAAEVEGRRLRLLAEDEHLVPGTAPSARDRARVDIRARSAQQVAVPEEDPHVAESRGSNGPGLQR
jgi:hypothetical protein